MRKVSILSRLAAGLTAAALFVSGCHYHMPLHAEMDGRVTMASRQVSKADRAGYTVATVEKALRHYDSKGREATLAYYNSRESADGAWYVVIADEDKEIVAHPNSDVLGESLFGPMGVDFTGFRHGEAIAGATEAGKWVDYIFFNPATGRDEYKHTWAVRHDGLIFFSGWYQVLPTLALAVTKAEPAEYTVAFVERAVRYYKAHGREEAVAYFSSAESVDGAWYIFIIDESGRIIAHPVPGVIGHDVRGDLGVDSSGFRYGELALSATEAGMWVDHLSASNPTKDGLEEEVKHTWVVRYDGVIIGSGWYE
ncbi:MAG: hypothetical protein OXH93_06225 [Caldilineaceae bacterium]|nr:hypothetical protein [Caldilineaceae bacterium]